MRSKLFQLLNAFEPKEWKAFDQFLENRNFASKEEILSLYRFAKRICLSRVEVEPAKEEILRQVFEGGEIDLKTFRYFESELVKWIGEWWIQQELKQNRIQRDALLLQALHRKGLYKQFNHTLSRAFSELEASPRRDLQHYWLRYQLNNLAFESASQQENRGSNPRLAAMISDLDRLYRTGSLKYGSLLINLGNVIRTPVDPELVEQLLAMVPEQGEQESPGAQVYYHILLTLTEPEGEAHYTRLMQLLDEKGMFFTQEEMGHMYSFALNYCIKKLNEGKSGYLQKLFLLYQRLLERKVIFSGPYIMQQHFKNIVTTAIRLEEFDWIEEFLAGHGKYLPPDARENAINYNWAALHFAKRHYSKALRLLQEVEFTDVYYHVDSKALLLKSYYELREWEPLLSLTEAFSNYLRRNRMLSDYQKKVYWNFVKYAKKLVRKQLGSRKPVKEIIEEMDKIREIADLRWLMLKAEELL